MISRRAFLGTMAGSFLAAPFVAEAQKADKAYRVGVLYPATLDPIRFKAIRKGLIESLGDAAHSVVLEPRSAESHAERLGPLAAELFRARVDVIFAIGPAAVRAVRAATTEVPIVALDLESDPVATGWIASLARPGGNITGIFFDAPEVTGKWIELLREAIPGLAHLALLWDPATGTTQVEAAETIAHAVGIQTERLSASSSTDLPPIIAAAARGPKPALLVLSSPIFSYYARSIAEQTLKLHLPAIMLFPQFVRDGGLLAYGPDNIDLLRQSGRLIAKVLKGTHPAALPVERPTRLMLLVNLRTAKALGLTIPPSILARADEVIE